MLDELVAVLNKKEFRKGTRQEALTEALNWCRDNNEHGKDMPAHYAAHLIESGILFYDPDHDMYDIIEPIKSWLEPHKIHKNPWPIPESCKYCSSDHIMIPPDELINRGVVSGHYPPKCRDCGKYLYPEDDGSV